jgi:uncharacterized damage-inducible protein DinB
MEFSVKLQLEYNLWAMRTLLSYLRAQETGISEKPVDSSFSGIRNTLLHITDAEVIWLSRLEGNPVSDWPSKTFSGNEEELYALSESVSERLFSFVSAQSDDFGMKKIAYTNMKGDRFENSVLQILLHLINHGSFHRGQIITMLRQLGVSGIPSTDMITFYRKMG